MSPRPAVAAPLACTAVAVAALVTTAVLAAQALAGALGTATPLTPYKEPQWWLGYDAGFVRRGLPGEVLEWLLGDPPGRPAVAVAGTVLTCAAALAVVPPARAVARRAPSRAAGLLAAAVVLASPLTVSLLLHDVGRYDGIGVIALAALACAPGWSRLPLRGAAVLAGGLLAAATAAQEVLLPFLAPAALLRVGAGRARPGLAVAVLAPAAAVAAASALLPAPEAVAVARAAALEAGVPPRGGWGDALDAVDRSLVENTAFFGFFEPAALAWSLVLWAGLYAATAALLTRLLGVREDRGWWLLVGWCALCAAALCVLGVDFRRWWGLALLALVAAAAVTGPGARRGPRDVPLRVVAAAAALLAVGVWAAPLPVFPVLP